MASTDRFERVRAPHMKQDRYGTNSTDL